MKLGGGPRVVVSTAAFHARARGSVPGRGGLKEKNKESKTFCYYFVVIFASQFYSRG